MQRAKLGLSAAILMVALSACAGGPARESTGEYLDDASITTKIKTAFVQDTTVSAMNVKVETFKGNVQLSGFANDQAEVERAVRIARTTPGVKSVKNDIRLKQP